MIKKQLQKYDPEIFIKDQFLSPEIVQIVQCQEKLLENQNFILNAPCWNFLCDFKLLSAIEIFLATVQSLFSSMCTVVFFSMHAQHILLQKPRRAFCLPSFLLYITWLTLAKQFAKSKQTNDIFYLKKKNQKLETFPALT